MKTSKEEFLLNNKLIDIINKTPKVKKKNKKILIISSFTIQTIDTYLQYLFGGQIEIKFINYGMWYQELENPTISKSFKPELIFILLHLEDLNEDLIYLNLHKKKISSDINQIINKINYSITCFRKFSNTPILISNFVNFKNDFQKYSGYTDIKSREIIIRKLNGLIAKVVSKNLNLFLFDYFRFVQNIGIYNIYNQESNLMNLSSLNIIGLKHLSIEIFHYIKSINLTRKKIIVTDLDNTLWGGILGEDGYQKIQIENSYPGNCYLKIQKTLLNAKSSGILLAISSKNNFEDVKELFSKRKNDLPIKLSDFSAFEINWQEKTKSIINISKKLNLGLNSFIFIDDSELECEKIQQFLPEVETICLNCEPERKLKIIENINSIKYFKITKEDNDRSKFYQEENKRNELLNKNNFDDYIKSLKLKLNIDSFKKENLDRTVQLINRTNQFNLTTKRYQKEEILSMSNSKNIKIFTVNLLDKFGSYGLIAVIIIKLQKNLAIIDSFLMSCRAMGRNVEKEILKFLEKYCLKNKIGHIQGRYKKTLKNTLVKDFYVNNRFEKMSKEIFVKKIKK